MQLKPIAYIHSPFKEKFGTPRQANVAQHSQARIVFTADYRDPNALRGIEAFDYLWLIWGFSLNQASDHFQATVRPPRLGGSERVGIFASRSPHRPNPLGLSAVKFAGIENSPEFGSVLCVSGIDLVDGTPIYDIKPYSAEADAFPAARSGFIDQHSFNHLSVDWSQVDAELSNDARRAIEELLANDPRPAYRREEAQRSYGIRYDQYNIRFHVSKQVAIIDQLEEWDKK